MKNLEFPLISTKIAGLKKRFDLNNPLERKKYFEAKVGWEIESISRYLEKNSFVVYLMGKKNSGKGTYAVLLSEVFGTDKIAHISVGDIVRETHANWQGFVKSSDCVQLRQLYRGYVSFDEAVNTLLGRSASNLLPTEFILALLKLKIAKMNKKTIFIDGLPRDLDQVSYSLYFRDLINFRDDPDMFILIDIPESIIDERIKYRRVCPLCASSRNLKLLPTSKIEYDRIKKEVYLVCDNPNCKGARMVAKEGDDLGVEPIRGRLDRDEEILRKAFGLHGIPKILLRNHVPVSEVKEYFDDYEITPEYVLNWDERRNKVEVTERPWSVKDDNGVESNSLLAAPVVVTLIKQLVEVLGL